MHCLLLQNVQQRISTGTVSGAIVCEVVWRMHRVRWARCSAAALLPTGWRTALPNASAQPLQLVGCCHLALQSCLLACPLVSLGATAPCLCRLMTPPHCLARSLNTLPAAGQQLQPGHPLGIYVGRLVPDAAAHLKNDQVVSER